MTGSTSRALRFAEGLEVSYHGKPGPKGSLNPWCVRCAGRKLPQKIAIKEESENGKRARQSIAVLAHSAWSGRAKLTGPIEVNAWVFIERRMQIKNGVPTGLPVPSESGPYPTHRNSGDIEKHVRTLHDALQDAGVLADDSQVVDLHVYKRWADEMNPEGVEFVITEIKEDEQ